MMSKTDIKFKTIFLERKKKTYTSIRNITTNHG